MQRRAEERGGTVRQKKAIIHHLDSISERASDAYHELWLHSLHRRLLQSSPTVHWWGRPHSPAAQFEERNVLLCLVLSRDDVESWDSKWISSLFLFALDQHRNWKHGRALCGCSEVQNRIVKKINFSAKSRSDLFQIWSFRHWLIMLKREVQFVSMFSHFHVMFVVVAGWLARELFCFTWNGCCLL